jgi:transcriptional regulator with XRE-family HTH domain
MADSIANRIKRLRHEQGLSLRALAAKAGVPKTSISGVEVGTRSGENLTAATCRKLARAFGVTLDYLIGVHGEEDEESHPVGVVA